MAVSYSTHAFTPELVNSSFAQVLHTNGPDAARAIGDQGIIQRSVD
jgi:hypothetical protein